MISKEILIGGGALVALVIGGSVAYAATRPAAAAAPAAGGPTFSFTEGQRYEIDVNIPAGATYATPSISSAQAAFEQIASGAFSVAGAGLSILPSGGVKAYFLVDALQTRTVPQSEFLVGAPTGSTVSMMGEGATPASAAAATSTPATTTTGLPAGTVPAVYTAPSSSSSSGAPAVASTNVLGQPTATGWKTTITVGPDSVGVTAWPGDSIEIALPTGATWAPSGSSTGFPTSGSSSFQGTYSSPVDVTIAWQLGGVTYSTTLDLYNGRTWGEATGWQTGDTVRISLSATNWQALTAAISASATELAALQADAVRMQQSGVNVSALSAAQSFFQFLQVGPWGTTLAIDPSTLKVWANAGPSSAPIGGQDVPSDWPATDTSGIFRAEFRYTGSGLSVSSLPFPLASWVRLT